MSGGAFTIGLDFGTDSVRALLFDVARGEEVASVVSPYEHGVIVERLPSGRPVAANSALQSPGDWLASLEQAVAAVLVESGVAGGAVRGIGVDFTSCTIRLSIIPPTPKTLATTEVS